MELTQGYLKEILDYNPETGLFIWCARNALCIQVGDIAGCVTKSGYAIIRINTKNYKAHRLAFLWMTGDWVDQVDHINREKNDNRWCNLRECSRSQNQGNRGIQSNNTSGYKGVSWHKNDKKWNSSIRKGKKTIYLGNHDCRHVAAQAYNVKALELFGDFAYLNEIKDT